MRKYQNVKRIFSGQHPAFADGGISHDNSNITVKKKTNKGIYKIKVKIMSTGNAQYEASDWKTVTVKINVNNLRKNVYGTDHAIKKTTRVGGLGRIRTEAVTYSGRLRTA